MTPPASSTPGDPTDSGTLHELGRVLAARHAEPAEPDAELSILNYAEVARVGDWSMRAALTRFAQPQAVRSAAVYQLIRRLDAALHGLAGALRRRTVICDRRLGLDAGQSPLDPYPDTRVADLARILCIDPDGFQTVLAGYTESSQLDEQERLALPLLRVALDLDDLAETLTEWANRGPADPPVDAVDATCAAVRAQLDELGVPAETRPPRGAR